MTHSAEIDAPYFCGLHDAGVLGARCQCPCPHTGTPVDECLCMIHDPDGAHFRATRTRVTPSGQGERPSYSSDAEE